MKKYYMKPALSCERMDHMSATIATCSNAEYWWDAITLQYATIFIPSDMPDCEMLESEYISIYGGNDGKCYHASVDIGQTFSS